MPNSLPAPELDPAGLKELFDALIAWMGDKWMNANIYATVEPSGSISCGATVTDHQQNSFSFTMRIVAQAAPAPEAAG
jgi:hypothetical protein